MQILYMKNKGLDTLMLSGKNSNESDIEIFIDVYRCVYVQDLRLFEKINEIRGFLFC